MFLCIYYTTKTKFFNSCLDEDEKEQMCKGLAEAGNQLLDSLKLGKLM